jgi:hypothetical protein
VCRFGNKLLPTTYYLLPTTYYLLPTTYYLLPTTYYLLTVSSHIPAQVRIDERIEIAVQHTLDV